MEERNVSDFIPTERIPFVAVHAVEDGVRATANDGQNVQNEKPAKGRPCASQRPHIKLVMNSRIMTFITRVRKY